MGPTRKTPLKPLLDYTFEQEIGMHLTGWQRDIRWKKLHPYIREGMEVLSRQFRLATSALEAEKHMDKGGGKDPITKGTNRFIYIFKTRYLELTDLECPEKASPATFHIIKDTVRKLIEAGSSPEEYLLWFYDQVSNSQSLSPTYSLVLSSAMFSKFLFTNADDLKQRRFNLAQNKLRWRAVLCATLVYEQTHDAILHDIYTRFKEGHVHEHILQEKAMEIARREGVEGIILQKMKEEEDKNESADEVTQEGEQK